MTNEKGKSRKEGSGVSNMHDTEGKLLKERSGAANIPIQEKWGPYVAERGWGTVREDYSESGDACMARPRCCCRLAGAKESEPCRI